MSDARDTVLARIRAATGAASRPPSPPRAPAYRLHLAADVDLLVERLVDYRAAVCRCTSDRVAETVGALLSAAAVRELVVAPGLDPAWVPDGVPHRTDDPATGPAALDRPGLAALTSCALAIAETGTVVLDASAGQGRRLLTLVPDHHVCVVPVERVVGGVVDAVRRLDPTRPLTWISGPSATSDIELVRVEGVHGPRHLHVVLVEATPTGARGAGAGG